uniref:4-hydroxybenzoate polyprenyltransferase, mitochondrial n=1 Tax=Leersia perrieri TaxID=77586 RepID=A0A0D9W4C8_9ORYZ
MALLLLRRHRHVPLASLLHPALSPPSTESSCPNNPSTPGPVARHGDLFAIPLRQWPRLLIPASSPYVDGAGVRLYSHLSGAGSAGGGDSTPPPQQSPPAKPPTSWVDRSITMAAMPGELPDMRMLALFAYGSVLIRGVGCTINDLLDRDIDRKIERTKSRPLASGILTPTQGVGFLGFQLLLGLPFLLQLNNLSQILVVFSLPLVFFYPLMKRFTYWPQAYLGLVANWGALIGWAAMKGTIDPAIILPMYTAGICWTLDKEDDLKLGVKSTALRFGDSTKPWISGFGAACIANLALTGYNADLAWPYYPFLAAASAHLAWQISTVDLSDPLDCNRKFVSNKWFGALIFGGILCGRLVS